MTTFSYKPTGVCSRRIDLEMDGHIIRRITFSGGCSGNTQGVAALVEYVDAAGFATEDLSCDEDVLYEYVKRHMDMNNLLNSELLVQLLYAFDNKYKNLYVNADIRDDGDYTLWKVPWDLNYSFGDRYSTEGVALTAYKLEWSQELMPEFMITETLLQAGNQEFAQLLNRKWKTLRETTFSTENIQQLAEESLNALVDSLEIKLIHDQEEARRAFR